MADLLLHSMAELAEIVLPVLELAGAKVTVEVGAEHGTMTRLLIEHAASQSGRLIAIDPQPTAATRALFAGHAHADLREDLSLDVLPTVAADAYLIDGDHNYYTVLHESEIIWNRCRQDGRPFLVLYHDVGWPCGRRDLYYAPDRIPAAYRQPHTWDHGLTLDQPGVIRGGFRGAGAWASALTAGGPRNGVLTAIEDFVAGKESQLVWAAIPAVFGLGVLFARDASWSTAVADFLAPYHMNPLLARLERNRLECYLRVLEWQDRDREQAA